VPVSDAGPFSEAALREGFESGQFLLVYQPIYDLQTSAFVGVEALIRWRHPERGLLTPDAFIDVLDSSDLVRPVAQWTLETACDQGAVWHDAGYRFRVSVNVSARQWGAGGIDDDVRDALGASRFDPTLLVLEVSRSTLESDPHARARLRSLAELGVHRAVDDFIPDEGELERLADLGVDVVKIDRTFLAGRTGSGELGAAVATLAARAEALGISVIAAGIEDADQREVLARESIATGQGFGLSEPYEADEIDRVLEDFSIFSGKPL
jgi:EAL domain-containing protein (putative c-di-GMP-specific phosphodiesterase class I)